MDIIDNPETELQEGVMYKKITHEYILCIECNCYAKTIMLSPAAKLLVSIPRHAIGSIIPAKIVTSTSMVLSFLPA